MKFLEAQRILRAFSGGPELGFMFAASGTYNTIDLYLRAAAAQRGRSAIAQYLPFNTLRQWLLTQDPGAQPTVILLFPWDLVPATDWRSGVPRSEISIDLLLQDAEQVAALVERRAGGAVLYVPAPIPPLFLEPRLNAQLETSLLSIMAGIGADILPKEWFSLSSYFAAGAPVAGNALGELAARSIEPLLRPLAGMRKVLVTDLDEVMWAGIVGEDTVQGLHCGAEGRGYRHFVYQSLLLKLEQRGVLLAAVSRNDRELAQSPFRAGITSIGLEHFVALVASYQAKSAQIAELAQQLNLGLEAFVFVDDNPLEIAEVQKRLPGVHCLQFPPTEEALPPFLVDLNALFARSSVTVEDRERTQLYRRRLESMVPSDARGADLTDFLRDLRMELVIADRTHSGQARAIQLINKTNQFNLNGQRFTEDEIAHVIAKGGRLITAALNDRSGSHGEILACLVDHAGTVDALVLSCRVFQRRVEHAFLSWLANTALCPRAFRFARTERNEPFRQFIDEPAFGSADANGYVGFDAVAFAQAHRADVELFTITEEVNGLDSAQPLV